MMTGDGAADYAQAGARFLPSGPASTRRRATSFAVRHAGYRARACPSVPPDLSPDR